VLLYYLPQHFLYFLPLPQGQGSFLPMVFPSTLGAFRVLLSLSSPVAFAITFTGLGGGVPFLIDILKMERTTLS
jgi:hypothetical protein